VRANVIGHKQGHDEDSFKLLKEMKGFSYEVKCKLFRKGGSEVQIQSVFKLIDRLSDSSQGQQIKVKVIYIYSKVSVTAPISR